jgi:hypothetical protein
VSGEHDGDHLQAARHQRRREPHLPPHLRTHRGAWSGAGQEERRGRSRARLRRPAGASAVISRWPRGLGSRNRRV